MTASNLQTGDGLLSTVVAGGYCVGCGACAVAAEPIEMKLTQLGVYQAKVREGQVLSATEERAAAMVCPFSAQANNEDDIAAELYAQHCKPHPEIGYYIETYAGHVVEGDFRARGSSGGMGTWLAAELLRLGLVDAVLHVKPSAHGENRNAQDDAPDSAQGDAESDAGRTSEQSPARSPLFEFSISQSPSELAGGALSRYYPITLADILQYVQAEPARRYALIGVPCFIKAARLLAEQEPVIAQAIRFHIGLVCGHLKSAAFAESLLWQAGTPPEFLTGINFRDKLEGRSAKRYGFRATARRDGEEFEVARPMTEMFGGDWGLGFFKYKACDFCDDVVAETADVVVGDAWLRPYDQDWRGTNVLVIRNPLFAELLATAATEGRICIEPLSADDVAKSQHSGLRHRREGLSHRLARSQQRREWHPPKRVAPGSFKIPADRRRIYDLRERLRDLSHAAFLEARTARDFSVFTGRMRPTVERYHRALRPNLAVRIKQRLQRMVKKLLGDWRPT